MQFLSLSTVAALALLLAIVPLGATASPQPTAERIDADTVILGTEYVPSEDIARITIRSDIQQAITISDAGAFQQGGKVPVRVSIFDAGETATIEMPVTEVNGRVGVAISTERTALYSEVIKESSGGLDVMAALTSIQAWLAGATIAFVWTAIAGWSVLRREGGRPEVA